MNIVDARWERLRYNVKQLGETCKSGNSALCVLVRKATPDKVLDALSPFSGTVLKTSLSQEKEDQLQKALSAI